MLAADTWALQEGGIAPTARELPQRGEEADHSGAPVDITPHARDYLNLVSPLWRKTWIRGNYSDRGFLKKGGGREGAGVPALSEVVAFQIGHMWTAGSDSLEHAG